MYGEKRTIIFGQSKKKEVL